MPQFVPENADEQNYSGNKTENKFGGEIVEYYGRNAESGDHRHQDKQQKPAVIDKDRNAEYPEDQKLPFKELEGILEHNAL
jgi:hypothetical protein